MVVAASRGIDTIVTAPPCSSAWSLMMDPWMFMLQFPGFTGPIEHWLDHDRYRQFIVGNA